MAALPVVSHDESAESSDGTIVLRFELHGGNAKAFMAREPDVLSCGPAGTGKTRTNLEWGHKECSTHPNVRGLFVRKTLRALKATALVTFDEKVQPQLDGVTFRGDTAKRPPMYSYPNGSTIAIGGMDQPSKVMGADYDFIIVFEATELDAEDWDALSTRLRNNALGYHQMRGDCNPGAPTHWLKQRCTIGQIRMITSMHEDNPSVTPDYLARLDRLTGVRYLRFRKGIWAAAEGTVYEHEWNPKIHLIPRFEIPGEWPRYWAIDWGFTHPFVWHCYARDGDGRLYLEHEIYYTHRTVPEHCATIKRITAGKPSALPQQVIADPADAGSRALFEHIMQRQVTPAENAIRIGIQAVQERLKLAGDERPRLSILEGSPYELDPFLIEEHLPTSTVEEFESYVWPTIKATALGIGNRGEVPVDENNHGMDVLRYMVAYFDIHDQSISYVEVPW